MHAGDATQPRPEKPGFLRRMRFLGTTTGSAMVAYAASKAAVAALTQALAEELASEGIWVNAIAPSIIDTPANRAAMPTADHDRWPKPAEIAETIAFLAAPENVTTRGAVVSVYGKS